MQVLGDRLLPPLTVVCDPVWRRGTQVFRKIAPFVERRECAGAGPPDPARTAVTPLQDGGAANAQ